MPESSFGLETWWDGSAGRVRSRCRSPRGCVSELGVLGARCFEGADHALEGVGVTRAKEPRSPVLTRGVDVGPGAELRPNAAVDCTGQRVDLAPTLSEQVAASLVEGRKLGGRWHPGLRAIAEIGELGGLVTHAGQLGCACGGDCAVVAALDRSRSIGRSGPHTVGDVLPNLALTSELAVIAVIGSSGHWRNSDCLRHVTRRDGFRGLDDP